jgi:hypothetical protein
MSIITYIQVNIKFKIANEANIEKFIKLYYLKVI